MRMSRKFQKSLKQVSIYHGTSSQVLSKGVGHLEGTSLPVGGQDTHTVLTEHTGGLIRPGCSVI